MTPLICTIYRSSKVEEMYLYVDKKEALARVPEGLLQRFGRPQPALTLVLSPARKLARADAAKVIEAIEKQGFYLQMPPEDSDFRAASPDYREAPAGGAGSKGE